MNPNRIEHNLSECRRNRRGALLPYLTAGCPDLHGTVELIHRADALGVPVVEIGFPFSDSIADGPVIQESFNYALAQGLRVTDTFRAVSGVRPDVNCGLAAMVSSSIVQRLGLAEFMTRAASAGFDGVILPDVPIEEADMMRAAAANAGLAYIGLIAPTTSRSRREAIVRASSGFVYQIAVSGTTGERAAIPPGLSEDVAGVRKLTDLPVCVGFGIGTAQQVRAVCSVADGAIVGSAIMRRILTALKEGRAAIEAVDRAGSFLCELVSATGGGQMPSVSPAD